MSHQRSISPPLPEVSPTFQIHELTNSPIKKNPGGEYAGEVLVGSPRSGIGASPSKHSRAQGRNNLRLAWAKSSNFRNTLFVPHGGSTHSVCSGTHILNYDGLLIVL